MRAADAVWGYPGGLVDVLVVTVPASLGLALDPGPRRRAWAWAGGLLGLFGLAVRLGYAGLGGSGLAAAPRALAGVAVLVAVAWVAAFAPRGRFRGPRWGGLAGSLAAAAGIVLAGHPLTSGAVQVTVALAVGLAFGGLASAPRHLRRRRDGLVLVPGTLGRAPAPGSHARSSSAPPARPRTRRPAEDPS
jgi:hypothetical protein